MLTLTRRWRRSIYSLSANGGEVKGYMGLRPDLSAQTRVGRPTGIRRPVAREGPVVWYLSDVRRFGSVDVAPDFRRRSDVQSLECVGRPGLVGHPLVWLGCGVAGHPVWAGRLVGLQASDVRS